MSWASAVSVVQLAASLALILRFLVAADPIVAATTTTDESTIAERTTYIVPVSSTTENDSDVYLGNSRVTKPRVTELRIFCAETPVRRFFFLNRRDIRWHKLESNLYRCRRAN